MFKFWKWPGYISKGMDLKKLYNAVKPAVEKLIQAYKDMDEKDKKKIEDAIKDFVNKYFKK